MRAAARFQTRPMAESAVPRETEAPAIRLEDGNGVSMQSSRRGVRQAVSSVLLGVIWAYKNLISPPLHVVLGPRFGCRFYPTCSDFAAEAVRVHGPLGGAWLGLCRLARCTPLHPGGVDFVPPRGALRPRWR